MGFLEYIRSEWGVVKGAPLAVVGFLAIGFVGGLMWRSQEVANIRSLIELRDGQLGKLGDLEKRMNEVEKKLSPAQISAIEDALKNSQPGTVQLFGSSAKPKDAEIQKQIERAFTDSGWQVESKQMENNTPLGLTIRAPTDDSASTVSKALRDAGLKYETVRPPRTVTTTDFILGNGPK